MRDRLIELLKQKSCVYVPCDNECGGCKNVEMYDDSIESIADHLLAEGVLAPPITIGQTVYTVIPADDEIDGGVFAEEVTGITYKGGKWYAIDTDGLALEVGSFDGCYLTREEAEKALEGSENYET